MQPNITHHIAVFSRVAEEGSFAKAARSLGVPPSRVSESVSKLEHHVGVSLFNRTTRKISLTSEGRMLFAHTSGILEGAERGLNQLRETKSVPMGSLRISVPTYLLSSRLSQAIGQFIARHSQVHVSADFTDKALDPVQDGYDMCIRSGLATLPGEGQLKGFQFVIRPDFKLTVSVLSTHTLAWT